MHAQNQQKTNLNKKMIFTKALFRSSIYLGISRQELSKIIGRSESTFSRIFNPQTKVKKISYLDPASKEGQLATLVLRLYKSLDVLFGGNSQQCQLWLKSYNYHFEGKPIELIQTPEGLVNVVQYLDAMRGKV